MSDDWGSPEFETYVAQYKAIEKMDDYKALHADLRRMQDSVDVDCLYSIWVDEVNESYVYMVDAATEDAYPIGCIDPFYVGNVKSLYKRS